jgi:hypothetical protein
MFGLPLATALRLFERGLAARLSGARGAVVRVEVSAYEC